jgi:excisionase family DNA binding protein
METLMSIIEQLEIIRKEVGELRIIKKDILNLGEACEYLNIGHSHLYKLTSKRQIPCYQPNGKKLYFKRIELDEWLLQNRKCAVKEINQMASDFILSSSKRKRGVR